MMPKAASRRCAPPARKNHVTTAKIDNRILRKFRAALDAMHGQRLERLVLFGSRARGDAREDSDHDAAVFLRNMHDRWAESDRIAMLTADILLETGEFIHALLRAPITSARP
jgi:uncharacterized protein